MQELIGSGMCWGLRQMPPMGKNVVMLLTSDENGDVEEGPVARHFHS